MTYEIDKTKFRHRVWGEGILRNVEENALLIEFPDIGLKRIADSSIQNSILTVVAPVGSEVYGAGSFTKHDDYSFRQYDSSDILVGGKNVLEAFETDDVVIFNESYIIIGDKTVTKRISATYDLTVIGNITVDEITVNGKLTVIGNISARKLICANTFICRGNVDSDYIAVGNIIAYSVKCVEFVCDGNALIETTIDIDKLSKTEKTMVACEGIIGTGSFFAPYAVANEYFEFTGDTQGRIIELESDTTLSKAVKSVQPIDVLSKLDIQEVMNLIKQRLQNEYQQCSALDEESIKELLHLIANNASHNIASYEILFDTLIRLSYQDTIEDFGDYLMVVYAKKVLPEEIYHYETIEHIDTLMLPKAENVLREMEFHPQTVRQIAMCIQIALKCSDAIPLDADHVMDKIFSSFGLHYSTVNSILQKTAIITSKLEKISETPTIDLHSMGDSRNPK